METKNTDTENGVHKICSAFNNPGDITKQIRQLGLAIFFVSPPLPLSDGTKHPQAMAWDCEKKKVVYG